MHCVSSFTVYLNSNGPVSHRRRLGRECIPLDRRRVAPVQLAAYVDYDRVRQLVQRHLVLLGTRLPLQSHREEGVSGLLGERAAAPQAGGQRGSDDRREAGGQRGFNCPEDAAPVVEDQLAEGLAARRTHETVVVGVDRNTLDFVVGRVSMAPVEERLVRGEDAAAHRLYPLEGDGAHAERGPHRVQAAEFRRVSDEVLALVSTARESTSQTLGVPGTNAGVRPVALGRKGRRRHRTAVVVAV